MKSTNKPMLVARSGGSRSDVVPMLLVFCLAYVLGLISNPTFQNFYLHSAHLAAPLLPYQSSSPPPPLPETPCTCPLPSPSLTPTMPSTSPSSPDGSPCTGLTGFLEPSGVRHDMTDEELLWRASMTPRIGRTPRRRVPKVAFLFLVRGEVPLRPLWEKFFAGHEGLYSIYVHTSPDYTGSPPEDSVFYGRMIPSQKTSWGSPNLVDAERRLLGNALLDLSNERFALLSESCIPILDFPTVYAYLTGSNTSFVDCFDRRDGRVRHRPFFASRNVSLAQWRKGAQWFEMDRALAVEVVSDETYYRPVFRAHHGVGNIEEHYIPTLVSLLGWGRRNANRTVTYSDWRHAQGPHPRSHGASNVTEALIREMRRGYGDCSYNGGVAEFCAVFARKFKPDALGPLLELAPKVMGFG